MTAAALRWIPASSEIRTIIRFLSARDEKAMEINRQISGMYGENAMSNGMVRKWVMAFKNGPTNHY